MPPGSHGPSWVLRTSWSVGAGGGGGGGGGGGAAASGSSIWTCAGGTGHWTSKSHMVPVVPSQFGSTSTVTLARPAAEKSFSPLPPTHWVSWITWPPARSRIRSLTL